MGEVGVCSARLRAAWTSSWRAGDSWEAVTCSRLRFCDKVPLAAGVGGRKAGGMAPSEVWGPEAQAGGLTNAGQSPGA